MSLPAVPPHSSTPRLRVDIWSDVACPWCYIGKRRFERALAQFPHADAVDVVWHSFELDPQAPSQVHESARDRLARKYGRSASEAQQMLDRTSASAAEEGLTYRFDRVQGVNTFLAHQLIHLAARHRRQDAMKERLLRAYFSEGATLSDLNTLVRLAAEVGLDAGDVRAALGRGDHAAQVRQDEMQAQREGIGGVPFFVLGGRYSVRGAQSPELLLSALQQTWAEALPRPVQSFGAAGEAQACEDGQCAVPQGEARG